MTLLQLNGYEFVTYCFEIAVVLSLLFLFICNFFDLSLIRVYRLMYLFKLFAHY